MNTYFCPACGFQNNYSFDKPTKCSNCQVVFAKVFNTSNASIAPTPKNNKSTTVYEQVDENEDNEVVEVPEVTSEDVKDIIIEGNIRKNGQVTVGDIWNDKDNQLTSPAREPVKIRGKKKVISKANELLNSVKTERKQK